MAKIIEFIRNFFNPPIYPEYSRKRRAIDSIDSYQSPYKSRRLQQTLARDLLDLDRENFFVTPKPFRRPPYYKSPTRHMETIILDEDDDVIEVKKSNVSPSASSNQNGFKAAKFTSTPYNGPKSSENGYDDEVSFVKEIKGTTAKKTEASKRGLNYIKPFSSTSVYKPRTPFKGKSELLGQRLNGSSKNLNYSIRLDDKMQYKKLLEISNDNSMYSTPIGQLFTYDTSNRKDRIMALALRSPPGSVKGRMSTKDTIKKVLGDYENESVILKDSDSDSDVVFVTPEPKPDIKVDRVNSFKKLVDTAKESHPNWLRELVNHQKKLVERRQKEVDELKECSEKHAEINKELRIKLLADKVHKSLQIKDVVLPVEEDEEKLELPELSKVQLKMVNRAFKGDPNEVLSQKFNLNITRRDLLTLAGLNWLNDEVINFYMNMIIERGKDSKWPNTFAFNTFFYPKLTKDGPQSLRRWTKRIDLFAQDLICVPIHLGMHWCMAIIDFRNKSIRYYDSMGSSNDRCLEALRKYLEAEHLDKKKSQYDTSDFTLENVKNIPQQMNGSDCGMFSCTFAEFITRNAKISFTQEHMPYLRQKMVVEILSGELLIR